MTVQLRQIPAEILLPDDWRDRVRYRLLTDVIVCGYQVPEGFETDAASVPRPLWALFPPVGRYFVAAVVHDFMLEQGMGWSQSNRVFGQILESYEINRWRRVLMVAGVCANGYLQHFKHMIGLHGRYVS